MEKTERVPTSNTSYPSFLIIFRPSVKILSKVLTNKTGFSTKEVNF